MMRKTCKRLCALTLTAVLAAGSLTLSGCDTSLDKKFGLNPDNPVSLELWHYYNGPQKESLDRLVTEFNETVGTEKGIVVAASSQGNVNDLMNKVLDSANKKVGRNRFPIFSPPMPTRPTPSTRWAWPPTWTPTLPRRSWRGICPVTWRKAGSTLKTI